MHKVEDTKYITVYDHIIKIDEIKYIKPLEQRYSAHVDLFIDDLGIYFVYDKYKLSTGNTIHRTIFMSVLTQEYNILKQCFINNDFIRYTFFEHDMIKAKIDEQLED